MEAYPDLDISKSKDLAYTAFKEQDVLTYELFLKDWSGTGKRFDTVYEAVKDIRVPSKEKAKKIFDDVWNNDPTYKKELTKTLFERYTETGMSPVDADIRIKKELSQDPFSRGMYALVRKGKDSEKLVDKFKSLGYDALEDYFDKGTIADNPLILLDPSSSVRKTGERRVTQTIKNAHKLRLNQLDGEPLQWLGQKELDKLIKISGNSDTKKKLNRIRMHNTPFI